MHRVQHYFLNNLKVLLNLSLGMGLDVYDVVAIWQFGLVLVIQVDVCNNETLVKKPVLTFLISSEAA